MSVTTKRQVTQWRNKFNYTYISFITKPDSNICLVKSTKQILHVTNSYINQMYFNQSNLFMKPFLHQPMSQSAVQKPSLKPQTESNADIEARWLGKTP